MASGYKKITKIKNLLKNKMTVQALASCMDCGTRTIFRQLKLIEEEHCGLHKLKEHGETFYVIQTEKDYDFNQDIIKQLEKIKKTLSETSVPDLRTSKILDKVISTVQTTNPKDFKPEAVSTDPDLVLDYGPFSDNNLQNTVVNHVLKAIHDRLSIRVTYSHASVKEPSVTKEIYPVKLIMRLDTLYLVAGEFDDEGNEIFKNYLFERISNVIVTSHPAPKFNFDAKVQYKYVFAKYISDEKPEEVSLEITAKWLQTQFEKSHFNPPMTMVEGKNGNKIVNLKIRITPDFKSWLMGVASDVRILKPASLKENIKQMLKDALSRMEG